jgi:hypothetical protein
MSEPRFRVVSTTGYEITPVPGGAHGNKGRTIPKVWTVLDAGLCFQIVQEWSPRGRPVEYVEREARELAVHLNAGGVIETPPELPLWRGGLCAGCECPHSEKTPGCKRCAQRHLRRAKARR